MRMSDETLLKRLNSHPEPRGRVCWDNAPTESWFNSFKNEWVHGLRFETHEET